MVCMTNGVGRINVRRAVEETKQWGVTADPLDVVGESG